MKIDIGKFGEILVSRPAGREAYLVMQAYQLKGVDMQETIDIDFSGVKVLTPSWADEVITKLVETYPNVRLINTKNASVQATLSTLRDLSGIKVDF